MVVREFKGVDFSSLIQLYKNFFPTHNQFQKNEDKIVEYLKEQIDPLLVIVEDEIVKGALYLVNFGQNKRGTHKLWKLRHFAWTDEKIFKRLLNAAEKKIKKESKTAKIELTVASTERGIELYKANGYEIEGTLKNHYRWKETCFVLGKSLE